MPCLEEPDAGNPHVRIRGGPGKATTRGYPTSETGWPETLELCFTLHLHD
jgi:hypothetical protein